MHRIYLAFLCFFRVLFGKPLPVEALPPAPVQPAPALPPAPAKPAVDPLYTAKTAPVQALPPEAVPRAAAAAPSGQSAKDGALQLLALLQREGRLVDVLREPIDGYDDATVGAAVRDIHRGCKKALDEHFTLEPVMGGAENDRVCFRSAEPTGAVLPPARTRSPPAARAAWAGPGAERALCGSDSATAR